MTDNENHRTLDEHATPSNALDLFNDETLGERIVIITRYHKILDYCISTRRFKCILSVFLNSDSASYQKAIRKGDNWQLVGLYTMYIVLKKITNWAKGALELGIEKHNLDAIYEALKLIVIFNLGDAITTDFEQDSAIEAILVSEVSPNTLSMCEEIIYYHDKVKNRKLINRARIRRKDAVMHSFQATLGVYERCDLTSERIVNKLRKYTTANTLDLCFFKEVDAIFSLIRKNNLDVGCELTTVMKALERFPNEISESVG